MFKQEYSPQSSKIFLFLLLFLHLLALAAVFISSFNFIFKIITIVFITLSFYFNGWLFALNKRKKSIINFVYDNHLGCWILVNNQNIQFECQLKGNSVVTQLVMVLNYRIIKQQSSLTLILFPDSLKIDDFRRLRVFLLSQ